VLSNSTELPYRGKMLNDVSILDRVASITSST